MARRGIGQQLRRTASGSTPHDRVTVLQIRSSCAPALDRPRQSALRYQVDTSSRPTIRCVRRNLPLFHQRLHRPPACRRGSTPVTHRIRGAQIPIARAAISTYPFARFPPLEAFGRRPPEYAATSLTRPASETLHNRRPGRPSTVGPVYPRNHVGFSRACRNGAIN